MKTASLTGIALVAGMALAGCTAESARTGVAVADAVLNPPSAAAPAGRPPTGGAPFTYRNAGRKFHVTLPAGWSQVSGDPNSDSAVFSRAGTSQRFQFHFAPMAPGFPVEASVRASLTKAKVDIGLGKNIAAKRRDDKCESNPAKICARGWELIDSGKTGPQRIIWQAYDGANYYYNFMGSAEPAEFDRVRASLQTIVDSIQFE